MENTSPFLFDNVDEKFFVAIKGRAVGPLTAQEVYDRIRSAEIGLLHYFWKEGWQDWKRVCDERDFAVLIPQKPTPASIEYIRSKLAGRKPQPAPTGEDAKNLYLYFNRSQYGPFSRNELLHVLKSHRLGRSAYLWTPGWANWKRMAEMDEYAGYFEAPAAAPKKKEEPSVKIIKKSRAKKRKAGAGDASDLGLQEAVERTIGARIGPGAGSDASEKRQAPRRPLVARLFLHNDKDVIIAVCRDISVGGMQVLTDRIPGPVGSTIKLNVSPGDPSRVKGFVAEGEIVRVLEDGRGFSFRFKKITEEARRMVERYINAD